MAGLGDIRLAAGLAALLLLAVYGGPAGAKVSQAKQQPAAETAKQLVDVAAGTLFDGWGEAAVRTLSMYYAADTSQSDVEMLGYRAAFLPVFDWANGAIDTAASASDLYSFYASGGGAGRVQTAADPSYAFSYARRYQEPKGRVSLTTGAGYALGLGATQSRTVASDYQNWSDAGLGAASGIDTTALENTFNTATSSQGFGASLTSYRQSISDAIGLTGLTRQAWQSAGTETVGALWGARTAAFDSALPSSLTPPPGVSGPMSAIAQRLFGNYFAGGTGQGNFIGSKVEADVLGQWGFAYDPNLAGSQHVFRDDAGRVRFFRSNPDLANMTSQGFRYVKYDQWSRVTEFGVLLNVAKGALADYADWARDADLDRQLTGANACPVILIAYDVDPTSGTVLAYDERRGGVARRSYYPTAIADQPVSCPGRGTSDPVQESLYQYDDLGRGTLLSEHRRDEGSDVYRTTAHSWPGGGLTPQMVFPDEDHSQAFATSGQGSVTGWPDLLGRTVRVCAGEDCSGVKYVDITQFDWTSSPLTVVSGNGMTKTLSYDLRGNRLEQSASLNGTVLFAEALRDMQIADDENPCPGTASSPDYSSGLFIGRSLSGSGLPPADQDVWDCYSYDGASRLIETDRYEQNGSGWQGVSSYGYGLDGNGNLASIATSLPSAVLTSPSLLPAAASSLSSFSRSGSDRIAAASLASGGDLTLSYDQTYGEMTSLAGASYSLTLTPDAVLRRPVGQTITDIASGTTLLSAAIDYEANGLRASRRVSAGSQGEGSSTTDYWYGGGLDPLVVERDGITYRLIGKLAVEQIDADNQTTRSYLFSDHLGSVRMIADDRGAVTRSLSYDGDWGQTRIEGETYAATDNGMASFYRYQGQEQDIFPLQTLDIDDSGLAGFLDRIGLYHFPLRDYASGLSAFLATDPIPTEDSPYRAFAANPVNFTDPSGGIVFASPRAARTAVFMMAFGTLSGASLIGIGLTVGLDATTVTTALAISAVGAAAIAALVPLPRTNVQVAADGDAAVVVDADGRAYEVQLRGVSGFENYRDALYDANVFISNGAEVDRESFNNLLQDSDFAAYTVSELRDANDRVSDLIQQARRLADDSAANAIDGAQLWAQRSFAGAGEGTAADLPARSALAHLEIDLYQRYAASELQIVQTLGARTPGLEQRLQTGQALLARLNQAIRDYDEEQRDIMGLDLVRDILRGGVPDDSRSSQHPHLEMGHQPREESSEHEEEDSDEKRDVEDTIR